MLPPCSVPAAFPRRKLFRPVQLSAERENLSGDGDARVPLGSLREYDPADFVRLVEALILLNLRETVANVAAMMMST
jgi:hypothetical protein